MQELRACRLNCTLKPAAESSSTDRLLDDVGIELAGHGVAIDRPVRVVDRDLRPGVTADEGDGDEWPAMREQILRSDIMVMGTPVWLGQPSSVAKRVLERMDAFLGETDDGGRMPTYGRVALVAVVGNEDGAHHVAAELYQALNDVGFSLAPNAVTYWVGEAMGSTDYGELDRVPDAVSSATALAVGNAVHLARLLRQSPLPAAG